MENMMAFDGLNLIYASTASAHFQAPPLRGSPRSFETGESDESTYFERISGQLNTLNECWPSTQNTMML